MTFNWYEITTSTEGITMFLYNKLSDIGTEKLFPIYIPFQWLRVHFHKTHYHTFHNYPHLCDACSHTCRCLDHSSASGDYKCTVCSGRSDRHSGASACTRTRTIRSVVPGSRLDSCIAQQTWQRVAGAIGLGLRSEMVNHVKNG